MKTILAILAISLLLLAGCSSAPQQTTQQQQTQTPNGPSNVEITDSTPTAPSVPADAKEAAEKQAAADAQAAAIDPAAQALIQKSASVTSLRYDYAEFISGTTGYFASVWVKGDKMKQRFLKRQITYKPGEKYDTAYINLATGSIEAYCETENICEDTDMNKLVPVDDKKFVLETPWDVQEELKKAKFVRNEMIYNKDAKVFELMEGENTKIIWVETFKGIPRKYEILSPSNDKLRSVGFESIEFNTVKNSDLVRS